MQINTADPRKASNIMGGQQNARASQKAHLDKKKEMLAALAARIDAEGGESDMEEEEEEEED